MSEPHFTAEKLLAMLGGRSRAMGKIALVPGPRERAEGIRAALEKPVKNLAFLDYEMHTGTVGGTEVTVANGGRYSADTAITTDLLCAAGVESLVRVGTCGSLQKHIQVGDVVVATGAIRGDGASSYYVPQDFSTRAHPGVVEALLRAAELLGVKVHTGRVFTTDAQQNTAAIDMVTATFLTVSQVRGRCAGAILAVSDECLTGKMGFRDPKFLQAEEKVVEIALKSTEWLPK
jgi:uridine phosphorylase